MPIENRIVAIDPERDVTLTRTAVEWITIATGILQAANDLMRGCEKPDTCMFCSGTAMMLQEQGLRILEQVAAAGDVIPPAHTDN